MLRNVFLCAANAMAQSNAYIDFTTYEIHNTWSELAVPKFHALNTPLMMSAAYYAHQPRLGPAS